MGVKEDATERSSTAFGMKRRGASEGDGEIEGSQRIIGAVQTSIFEECVCVSVCGMLTERRSSAAASTRDCARWRYMCAPNKKRREAARDLESLGLQLALGGV